MLNGIWAGMIVTGVIYGAITGNLSAVTDGMLAGIREGTSLGITMLGLLAFWNGLLNVGQEAGVVEALGRCLSPLMRLLFPGLLPEEAAYEQICVNLTANFLGLGSAATPAGLKAMEELKNRREYGKRRQEPGQCREPGCGKSQRPQVSAVRDSGEADSYMSTFLILNCSSLQLVPVTILAYRSQYGSPDPAAIVGPAILATAASTVSAILYCMTFYRFFPAVVKIFPAIRKKR